MKVGGNDLEQVAGHDLSCVCQLKNRVICPVVSYIGNFYDALKKQKSSSNYFAVSACHRNFAPASVFLAAYLLVLKQ